MTRCVPRVICVGPINNSMYSRKPCSLFMPKLSSTQVRGDLAATATTGRSWHRCFRFRFRRARELHHLALWLQWFPCLAAGGGWGPTWRSSVPQLCRTRQTGNYDTTRRRRHWQSRTRGTQECRPQLNRRDLCRWHCRFRWHRSSRTHCTASWECRWRHPRPDHPRRRRGRRGPLPARRPCGCGSWSGWSPPPRPPCRLARRHHCSH